MSNEQITGLKKRKFKAILRKKVNEAAFDYLNKLKIKHSKVNQIHYSSLKKQSYINDSNFSINDIKLLFKLRTRMLNVKANFRNQFNEINLTCDFCNSGQ